MTNQDLLNYHSEIQQLAQAGSILIQFNKSRIKEFYRYNEDKIHTLQNKLNRINKSYFEYEEIEGKTKIKFTGEGKDKKPVFLDGKNEEGYTKERGELLNTLIVINF